MSLATPLINIFSGLSTPKKHITENRFYQEPTLVYEGVEANSDKDPSEEMRLWRELWGTHESKGSTLDSFCQTIKVDRDETISSGEDRAQVDSEFRAIKPLPLFPKNLQALYIRAEFKKTLAYLNHWLYIAEKKEGRLVSVGPLLPVDSLERDVERLMGEQSTDEGQEDADMADVNPMSTRPMPKNLAEYNEGEFAPGRESGAFVVIGHPGIGEFTTIKCIASLLSRYRQDTLPVLRSRFAPDIWLPNGLPTNTRRNHHLRRILRLYFRYDQAICWKDPSIYQREHVVSSRFQPHR